MSFLRFSCCNVQAGLLDGVVFGTGETSTSLDLQMTSDGITVKTSLKLRAL